MKTEQSTPQEHARSAVKRRIAAAIIDLILCVLLFIVMAKAFGSTTHVVRDGIESTQINLSGLPALVYGLIILAYYIFMEWKCQGTFGKLAMKIKVVNTNGDAANLQAIATRNILRVVDAFPFVIPYLAGIFVLASSPDSQRFGDKIAQTWVVRR